MQEILINGLKIEYDKDRDLFNKLLQINGVSKKKFCEKFSLSYSYVNSWGSFIKNEEKKFPNWVFIYLKDIMYYKIAAIRVKIGLEVIQNHMNLGKNLSDIYKEVYSKADDIKELDFL